MHITQYTSASARKTRSRSLWYLRSDCSCNSSLPANAAITHQRREAPLAPAGSACTAVSLETWKPFSSRTNMLPLAISEPRSVHAEATMLGGMAISWETVRHNRGVYLIRIFWNFRPWIRIRSYTKNIFSVITTSVKSNGFSEDPMYPVSWLPYVKPYVRLSYVNLQASFFSKAKPSNIYFFPTDLKKN